MIWLILGAIIIIQVIGLVVGVVTFTMSDERLERIEDELCVDESNDYERFPDGTTGVITVNLENVRVIGQFGGMVEILRTGDDFPTLLPEELVNIEFVTENNENDEK